MKDNLAIIRDALEEISVKGRRNIELMSMCMDALDAEIVEQKKAERNAGNGGQQETC